ncbi:hypothetical protein ACFXHA_07525 [Nocardia sp. NPDC059240]|uniref:hypothetical protein n=1 Tax=Nocardia sp. NPDC059240 TaxID=3346786 RepID=UPI00368CEA6B
MRKMLGDAVAVLVGVMAGIAIVVGACFWLLYRLAGQVGDSTWDGEMSFIADCKDGSPCFVVSVPAQTPRLALTGRAEQSVSLPPVPTIAGLQSGDRVSCKLHVEVFAWGQAANDPVATNTVDNCHRA